MRDDAAQSTAQRLSELETLIRGEQVERGSLSDDTSRHPRRRPPRSKPFPQHGHAQMVYFVLGLQLEYHLEHYVFSFFMMQEMALYSLELLKSAPVY